MTRRYIKIRFAFNRDNYVSVSWARFESGFSRPLVSVRNTMKRLVFSLQIAFFISIASGFINVYPKLKSYPFPDYEDVGEPLFLTPLIESGKIEEARNKALVQHKEMNDVSSYAGYLTVNKDYNSNMFFWFFPAVVSDLFFFIDVTFKRLVVRNAGHVSCKLNKINN